MKKSVIALSLLAIFFLVLVSGCTNLSNNNGKIIISTIPNGSEVYLNDTYKGTTPNVIDALSPGAYEIELRSKDYQTYSELITIQPNDVHHISVSLIPTTPTPRSVQTTITYPVTISNSGENIPLTIVSRGNGNYHSYDTITFTGTGPKGQLISISISESTGISSLWQNAVKVNDDGTWGVNLDLRKEPISTGQAIIEAFIWETNTRSSPLLINILP